MVFIHFTFSKANLDYQTSINDHCRLFFRGPVSMNMLLRPTSTGWHYAQRMTSSKTDGIVREYCVCFACSDITCCISDLIYHIICNEAKGYITVMLFEMLVKSLYIHSRFIL